jgi:hypothetical protein
MPRFLNQKASPTQGHKLLFNNLRRSLTPASHSLAFQLGLANLKLIRRSPPCSLLLSREHLLRIIQTRIYHLSETIPSGYQKETVVRISPDKAIRWDHPYKDSSLNLLLNRSPLSRRNLWHFMMVIQGLNATLELLDQLLSRETFLLKWTLRSRVRLLGSTRARRTCHKKGIIHWDYLSLRMPFTKTLLSWR